MSTSTSVRLPERLAGQLDLVARETQRPRSFIIQKALESYIQEFADLRIASDRLHDKGDGIVSTKQMKESRGISRRPQKSVDRDLCKLPRAEAKRIPWRSGRRDGSAPIFQTIGNEFHLSG